MNLFNPRKIKIAALLVFFSIGLVYTYIEVMGGITKQQDEIKLTLFLARGSLGEVCDRLDITPTSRGNNVLRERVLNKMVETHPQLSLSINKIMESGQFTAQNRFDLCQAVGLAEKATSSVKQTIGLDKPPFG